MKNTKIAAAVATGAGLFKTVSTVSLIMGAVYLADCRFHASRPGDLDQCYMTALPLMGVGVAGHGGYQLGYRTYNPALRPDDDDTGELEQPEPDPEPEPEPEPISDTNVMPVPPDPMPDTAMRDSHGRFVKRRPVDG